MGANRNRNLKASALLALAGAAVLAVLSVAAAVENGEPAPRFSLKDLNDRTIRSSKIFGKFIVVLDFMAVECTSCVAELPDFEKLYEKYGQKGVVFFAIAIDSGGKEVVKPFIEEKGYKFGVLLDPDKKVAKRYDALPVPHTYVIAKNKKVYSQYQYREDLYQVVADDIEALLGQ